MPVGEFRSPQARERFLTTYRQLFARLWPAETKIVDLPTSFGVTRAYRVGAGPEVPFLLLPGSGGGAITWYAYVRELARTRPVIAIDPVGEPGESVQEKEIFDGKEWARYVDEVLTALDVPRVHTVGLSYGGWVGLEHALHSPARVASLSLLDPGGFGRVSRRFLAWVIAGGLAALTPTPIRHALARPVHNETLLDDDLMRLARASFTFRRRHVLPTPLSDEELGRLKMPVLALLGARSQLFDAPSVAERIRSTIPDVRVEVVPGVGHDLPVHNPAELAAQIAAFIDEGPG